MVGLKSWPDSRHAWPGVRDPGPGTVRLIGIENFRVRRFDLCCAEKLSPPQFANPSSLTLRPLSRVAVWMAAFGMIAASAGAADVFDATADYSITNNPNGVWSAGYKSTLSSPFVVYDQTGYVANSYSYWNSSTASNQVPIGAMNFYKNFSNAPIYGLAPNMIALHPGPLNQYSILRFTAPKAANYYLQLQFFAGNTGDTDGFAILNDNSANPLFYAATTNTSPTFSSYLNLNLGDFVDVVVGSKGNYNYGTTPISVVFTEQAVPEPQSVILGLFAAGGLAAIARCRNPRQLVE